MNSQMIKIRAFLLSKIWKVNTFIIIKEKIFINKNKIKDKIKKNQFKRKQLNNRKNKRRNKV